MAVIGLVEGYSTKRFMNNFRKYDLLLYGLKGGDVLCFERIGKKEGDAVGYVELGKKGRFP